MLGLFRGRRRTRPVFCDRCGSVCDDGCRRDAVVSSAWVQAHHYGYGGRL